jgi:hypothetical protein
MVLFTNEYSPISVVALIFRSWSSPLRLHVPCILSPIVFHTFPSEYGLKRAQMWTIFLHCSKVSQTESLVWFANLLTFFRTRSNAFILHSLYEFQHAVQYPRIGRNIDVWAKGLLLLFPFLRIRIMIWSASQNWECFRQSCRDTQNTLCCNLFFRKSYRLWDKVEKYFIAEQVTDDNVRDANCMPDTNTTNTPSVYVIPRCFFHCNNGYKNMPQCYVIRVCTSLALFIVVFFAVRIQWEKFRLEGRVKEWRRWYNEELHDFSLLFNKTRSDLTFSQVWYYDYCSISHISIDGNLCLHPWRYRHHVPPKSQ